jgi:hypothetical protein
MFHTVLLKLGGSNFITICISVAETLLSNIKAEKWAPFRLQNRNQQVSVNSREGLRDIQELGLKQEGDHLYGTE